jgi:two-component system chemotaxis sensor kinase CheA
MPLTFDISPDEMPLFMAETEDHLQVLEEGLVKLEQEVDDPELIQALFRSAHTLKGMAGMIGHTRLVKLTHALETGFDGIRKKTFSISSSFIDICLKSIDALRTLREEVIDLNESNIDVEFMVEEMDTFIRSADIVSYSSASETEIVTKPTELQVSVLQEVSEHKDPAVTNKKKKISIKSSAKMEDQTPTIANIKDSLIAPKVLEETNSLPAEITYEIQKSIKIEIEISPKSVASAARAFQIMMVLQSSGTIQEMSPNQEEIETSKSVQHFVAMFVPNQPIDLIRQDLTRISEIDRIVMGDATIELVQPKSSSPVQSDESKIREPIKLGQFFVENGTITEKQLNEALKIQQSTASVDSPTPLLGQILVKMGAGSQDTFDRAIAKYMQQQKTTIAAVQEAEKAKDKTVDKTVRTSVERLDTLMNLVGELITDRNRINQLRNQLEVMYRGNDKISSLSDTIVHIGRITDQLQEEVMHIRMLPISNVFAKFPRLVRDLAQKTGKELDLVLKGQDTELDRSVIEELNDPLIHLLRNSVDHGIETPAERIASGKNPRGTVTLSARHEQGRIVLTVEDDGNGINIDKLKASAVTKGLITQNEAATMSEEKAIDLIFLSGLSTSATLSDISGRGVGMDIVRTNIERLNGTIVVETHPGRGSIFGISLPLTLAIVPTLLIRASEITFAIPLVMVVETQHLQARDIKVVNGKPVTQLRDKVITLIHLSDVFNIDTQQKVKDPFMVVVRSNKLEIGLIVDSLMGEEEVVVKLLNSIIGETPGISSAAILGDGQVALILDVAGLYKVSGLH